MHIGPSGMIQGPVSQIGRGGGGALPEVVDAGYCTLTATGTQWHWYTVPIPLSNTLDDPSHYWLETDLGHIPQTGGGSSAVEAIDVALTSTTALTCYYMVVISGRVSSFTWRLFKVPGLVQRGRFTHNHSAGWAAVDIPLGTAVSGISKVSIGRNWGMGYRQGTAATNQNQLFTTAAGCTSPTNLQYSVYSSKTTTFTIPWQVWDPEG